MKRSWVQIPLVPFRMLGKFVYPTLPKSLGMLLVYPKRIAVGVKPKEALKENHRCSSHSVLKMLKFIIFLRVAFCFLDPCHLARHLCYLFRNVILTVQLRNTKLYLGRLNIYSSSEVIG